VTESWRLAKMLRPGLSAQQARARAAFSSLKEAAPRQGFFELEQFGGSAPPAPDDLRVVVTIAHTFGWRVPSDSAYPQRRQLDLEAETLRLDPGTTRTRRSRGELTPELRVLLTAQVARVDALQRRLGRIVPWLFPHSPRMQDGGLPTGTHGHLARAPHEAPHVWITACKAAGVPWTARPRLPSHRGSEPQGAAGYRARSP